MKRRIFASSENMTLSELLKHMKFTGPSYRGDRMPEFHEWSVNESRIPDNMRMKEAGFELVDDNIMCLYWITQDPFTSKDAKSFEDEVVRAVTAIANKFNYTEPFILQYEVTCRDGRDDGYVFNEVTIN